MSATWISDRFDHQVAPLAMVAKLTTRWRHLHCRMISLHGFISYLSWYLHPDSHQLSLISVPETYRSDVRSNEIPALHWVQIRQPIFPFWSHSCLKKHKRQRWPPISLRPKCQHRKETQRRQNGRQYPPQNCFGCFLANCGPEPKGAEDPFCSHSGCPAGHLFYCCLLLLRVLNMQNMLLQTW